MNTRIIELRCSQLIVRLIPFGARVISISVPDKKGVMEDIVISPASISGFSSQEFQYHGATIGRYANRIANGRYTYEGKTVQVTTNEKNNSLHGGITGFHNVDWKIDFQNSKQCTFTYQSKNGEEGFPGNLDATLIYEITAEQELTLTYSATTDAPTPVNFTHHSYFNLSGNSKRNIDEHYLQIKAQKFLPTDKHGIPLGLQKQVSNGPFDFNATRKIGRTDNVSDQLSLKGGYDHTFVIDTIEEEVPIARLEDKTSGRYMEIVTSEPGLQLYTCGHLKNESIALCLEPQHFPDSPNRPEFPNTFLNPGEVFHSFTKFRFGLLS